MMPDNSPEMKLIKSDLEIDATAINNQDFKMSWYIGPNENKRLNAFNNSLEDIIPYGWSFWNYKQICN